MSGRQPCVWCGVATVSPKRVCQGCVTIERRARMVPDDDHALKDGAWVLDPATRVLMWEPSKLTDDDGKIIACRRCEALPHQTCRSKNGHRTQDHLERHIPRCCPCGGEIERGHQLCASCKRWSRKKVAA